MKVLFYGVADSEKPIFEKMNEPYQHELILRKELLNRENAQLLPAGVDAIVLFVNCLADATNLALFKEKGVKYVLTRTAGFDHIDLKAATDLGYVIGRVPSYSPTAVASLAFANGVSLLRRTNYITNETRQYNFQIDSLMFAKEFKNSVIGIIGTGKIGYETAKFWKGTGAKVLGYDVYPTQKASEILEYTTLEQLLKASDLISLHIPYIKGENDQFINEELISSMKDGAVVINVSRKNLADLQAIIKNLKNNKLLGYAADVFDDEEKIVNQKLNCETLQKINPQVNELVNLYPRVLLSPHLAYFTDEAVKNMAETTFLNLQQLIERKTCDNAINEILKPKN